ncbi:MAG: MFS transporter [Bacilli bacterium]
MGAFFVGVIGGGALLGMVTKRVSLRVTLMAGLLVAGACIGSVGAFADAYWTIGVLLVCGLSIGILNGSLGAMAVAVIPQQMRGRVFGLLGALSTIATPLGMAVFGGLMVYIPLAALFAVMGSLSVLSGLSFLLPVKDDLANLRSVEQNASTP